jgi:hypothetical protein
MNSFECVDLGDGTARWSFDLSASGERVHVGPYVQNIGTTSTHTVAIAGLMHTVTMKVYLFESPTGAPPQLHCVSL